MIKRVAVAGGNFDSQELVSAYTSRQFGSLSARADASERVDQRYQTIAHHLGVEVGALFCVPQTHSTNIVVLKDRKFLNRPLGTRRYQFEQREIIRGSLAVEAVGLAEDWQRGIDGVILSVDGLFPVILTADCAPVMFWAPSSRVCGIAHIGLVGAINLLAAQMVRVMRSELGVASDAIEVAILPSIRGCHYELVRSGTWQRIKGEVGRLYGADNPLYRDGFFRLPEFIRWQLQSEGVSGSRISDLGICTVCQSGDLFSHVQAGFSDTQATEGRFGSLIGMKKS